jgi:hypothetical protein
MKHRRVLEHAGVVTLAAVLWIGALGCREPDSDASASSGETDSAAVVVFQDDSAASEIVDLAVDDAGGVWALSSAPPFIRHYDPAGTLLDTLGKAGVGPGELKNPWSIMVVDDSVRRVRVWDPGTRRITALGAGATEALATTPMRTGSLVRGDIRAVTFGRPNSMRALRRGYVLQMHTAPMTQTSDQWRSILVHVDSSGGITDTIADFRSIDDGSHTQSIALGPIPLWTVCGDSTVVVLDPTANRLRWIDPTGKALREQPVDSARRELSDDDLRPYLRRVLAAEARGHNHALAPADEDALVSRALSQQREHFATVAPNAVDMLCDDEGRIWLQSFSTADHPLGYGRAWRVHDLSSSGSLVTFPQGFAPRHLAAGKAVGVLTDSLDVQRVAAVRYAR